MHCSEELYKARHHIVYAPAKQNAWNQEFFTLLWIHDEQLLISSWSYIHEVLFMKYATVHFMKLSRIFDESQMFMKYAW